MTRTDPDYNKTIKIYAALSASLVFSFIPNALFAGLASLLFLGTLIVAYIVRRKAEPHSLADNHMTYVIRTLWISSLWALFTVAAGSAYILTYYDPEPLQRCIDLMLQNTSIDYGVIAAKARPCIDQFLEANRDQFLIGSIITIAPAALYFVYRLAHGLSRAHKGYRVANVKSWF